MRRSTRERSFSRAIFQSNKAYPYQWLQSAIGADSNLCQALRQCALANTPTKQDLTRTFFPNSRQERKTKTAIIPNLGHCVKNTGSAAALVNLHNELRAVFDFCGKGQKRNGRRMPCFSSASPEKTFPSHYSIYAAVAASAEQSGSSLPPPFLRRFAALLGRAFGTP